MNKKIITVAIFGILVFPGIVHAQTNITLPSAGIRPDSIFFFLDRFGEALQEFFTFNPEAKARLQIKFAGERIAEINAMMEEKGPEAKGIDKAKNLLLGNVAYAAEIIKEEKAGGKNIAKLAKDIDDEFDAQEKLLIQTFQDARKKLKKDRIALKRSFAKQSGDAALVVSLEQQIQNLEKQDDVLKSKKDSIKDSLRNEKKKIEEELDDEDKEMDKKEEIEEDKNEEIEEMEIEDKGEEEKIEKQEAPETPEASEASEIPETSEPNKDKRNKNGEDED